MRWLFVALALVAMLSSAHAERIARPSSIASIDAATCARRLVRAHVEHTEVEVLPEGTRIALRAGLAGFPVSFVGRDRTHAEMDCRLALALLDWVPTLRAAGITGLRHLSAFRRGAVNAQTGRTSGHASGRAIDVRYFDRADGSTWDVTVDWGTRELGAPPCGTEQSGPMESTPLRRLVCDAVRARRFQVVVTPNRDDDHADHVHLELVPEVTWTYAR